MALADAIAVLTGVLSDLGTDYVVLPAPPPRLVNPRTMLVIETPGDSRPLATRGRGAGPAFQVGDVLNVEAHHLIQLDDPVRAIAETRELIEVVRAGIWAAVAGGPLSRTYVDLRAIRTDAYGPMDWVTGNDQTQLTFGFRLAIDGTLGVPGS